MSYQSEIGKAVCVSAPLKCTLNNLRQVQLALWAFELRENVSVPQDNAAPAVMHLYENTTQCLLSKAQTSPAVILTLKSCTCCFWNSALRVSPLYIPAPSMYNLDTVGEGTEPTVESCFCVRCVSNTHLIQKLFHVGWEVFYCSEFGVITSSLQPLPALASVGLVM